MKNKTILSFSLLYLLSFGVIFSVGMPAFAQSSSSIDSSSDSSLTEEDGDYPEENGDYPEEDGDYPEEDGDYPEEDGDYPEEDEDNESASGFHGDISLTYLRTETTSNSYDGTSETQTESTFAPTASLSYVDQDEVSNWFLQLEETISIGRAQQTSYGFFTLTLAQNLVPEEDSADPYSEEEEEEEETTTSQFSYSLDYEYSFNDSNKIMAGYTSTKKTYDNDLTPEIDSALGRSFSESAWSLGYDFDFLELQYTHTHRQAEGGADSGIGVSYNLSLTLPVVENIFLLLAPSLGEFTYNQEHPIFNKLQVDKTTTLEATLAYLYSDKYTFYFIGSSTETKSNIDFFEQKAQEFTLGGSWSF